MYKIQPKTLFIGKNMIYLPSCHSTNDIAAKKIQNDEVYEGTIIVTEDQWAGRGQRGNSWETLPGQNITMSLVLQPTFLKPTEQFSLNIAISLAIYHFLEQYKLPDLCIKWPNDVYIGDRKMGGVLIENILVGNKMAYSVVGIGLNINQLDFSDDKPISLRMATQKSEFALDKLIESLCENLEKYYLQLKTGKFQAQREAYLGILYRWEEWHKFKQDDRVFLGKIVGVNETGSLIVECENEQLSFGFKEIEYII